MINQRGISKLERAMICTMRKVLDVLDSKLLHISLKFLDGVLILVVHWSPVILLQSKFLVFCSSSSSNNNNNNSINAAMSPRTHLNYPRDTYCVIGFNVTDRIKLIVYNNRDLN